MTDEEMLALDTQMKLQAMILMIRNVYAYVDRLDGHSGHVADGLRAFLDESLPALSLPFPVPEDTLGAIKEALAEPLRAVIADLAAGEPTAPPPPPKFTLVRGGLENDTP